MIKNEKGMKRKRGRKKEERKEGKKKRRGVLFIFRSGK